VAVLTVYQCAGEATGRSFYVVRATSEGFDAHGKLAAKDRIVAIEGHPLFASRPGKSPDLFAPILEAAGGRAVEVEVLRNGERKVMQITRPLVPETGRCILGLTFRHELERSPLPFAFALGKSLVQPLRLARTVVRPFTGWLTGSVEGELAGAVMTVAVTRDALTTGWTETAVLIGMLAVYFGLLLLVVDAIVGVWHVLGRDRPRAENNA